MTIQNAINNVSIDRHQYSYRTVMIKVGMRQCFRIQSRRFAMIRAVNCPCFPYLDEIRRPGCELEDSFERWLPDLLVKTCRMKQNQSESIWVVGVVFESRNPITFCGDVEGITKPRRICYRLLKHVEGLKWQLQCGTFLRLLCTSSKSWSYQI